jgi:quinoprotein glucose dehydrogenase
MAAHPSIDERRRRSHTIVKTLLTATLLLGATAFAGSASSVGADAKASRGASEVDWSYFGGSKHMDRYSPLAQINRGNLDHVQVLWKRPGLDASLKQQFPDLVPSNYLRGTPIMIDGVLYAPDAVGLVEAFDASTGQTLWVQKPFAATMKEAAGQSTREVDLWRSGTERRIVSMRGQYLYELDAHTGAPITSFGDGGRISLNRHTPDNAPFFAWNGPIVVGDVIVVGGNGGGLSGAGYGDGGFDAWARPEDIRGFDVRTGKQLWQFHVQKADSWGKGSADHVGNMAAWAPLSADERLGIVYVPTSAPTVSYYGGHRPGNNLYSDCLLALDAKSGKLIWYFQMVHHDVWDYDNASAPTLGDITVDGKRIPAVMQPNKSGYLFVFDRRTGKPVWPIEERPVPKGILPGEELSPTQPIPTKPPAFDRQGVTEDDLMDFTPALHAEALKFMQAYVTGPVFTPPSLADDPTTGKRGTLTMPNGWGSGNWNTGAFDPDTGIYYAVSATVPGIYGLQAAPADERGPNKVLYGFDEGPRARQAEQQEPSYGPGPEGLPLLKPPYGRVTALNLSTGEKLWTIANGDGPRNEGALKSMNLPPLGTIGRPAALVTKTLLFVGESSDAVMGRAGIAGTTHFYAYDKASGARLWATELPAGTTGGPITYQVQGKQFIVVPVGGKDYGSGWIAFGLK